MKIWWDWQAIVEIVGVNQVAGTSDVKHDRDAGGLGLHPHRIEAVVARRVARRTSRSDEQCRRAVSNRFARHLRCKIEIHQRHVTRRQ